MPKPRQLLFAALLLLGAGGLAYWGRISDLERRYDGAIRSAAQRYRVDAALVKAIVWQESRFHAHARGTAQELGLMQLQEVPAQDWADAERIAGFQHEHCLDPRTNTLAGTWYLSRLLRRYQTTDNPLPYALADYNAGRGNVLKWNGGAAATNSAAFVARIGFPRTQEYVEAVLDRYAHYRRTFK